ncbi:PdxA family dehydrogenase [Candidatus Palauibacter sp.]|uniref:PdxA family dehydrogenase n=1 Tax=Candidatus Palauibacter sp. TaxID=3101350 RepID=UPI003B013CF7
MPRLGITLGDPRGIGPEVTAAALSSFSEMDGIEAVLVGPRSLGKMEDRLEGVPREAVGDWDPAGGEKLAGVLSGRAIERAVAMARAGEIDGIVTAPISKAALRAAGYTYPGHTEFLQELAGAHEVTMMMAAERTPLGGSLRLALLTAHLPLRDVPSVLDVDLFARRSQIAIEALRVWWGIERPRLAFAGLNPHAGEGGLFGNEEIEVFAPALARLGEDPDLEILGVFPGDTVFLKALSGEADLVVTPYHDVGLAVLKTIAMNEGVNVTAGLPFPRTSPDHGTAMDIAGRGVADPGAMRAAIDLCARFCAARVAAG